jgi:type IV pilus assembly protein PilC
MNFEYIAFTKENKIAKGSLIAADEAAAVQALAQQGYRALSLKSSDSISLSTDKLFPSLFKVKVDIIVLFSRQLALLLESGTNMITALELLQSQMDNKRFKNVLKEVASDLRGGDRLSTALGKHQDVFPDIYLRSLGVAEQSGNLETVLRQMAEYLEKEAETRKKIKGALMYPAFMCIFAVVVIAALVLFIVPAFSNLYDSLGAELPAPTRLLMTSADWIGSHVIILVTGAVIIVALTFFYIKTPSGKFQWNKMLLSMPMLGRVSLLNELARACRTISLLFKAGLPLPEITALVVDSTGNRVIAQAFSDVRGEMIKGEGLSKPMMKNPLFLPMMVQMVRVGEETGSLDSTLGAVADSYEVEAADKTKSLIGLIQPTIMLFIGAVVGFIAISMMSTMFSMYGQFA